MDFKPNEISKEHVLNAVKKIDEQKITIPKEPKLTTFTEKVKPIFSLIRKIGNQNSILHKVRDI